MISAPHQILSDSITKNKMSGARSTWWRGEEHTGFWSGNLRERPHGRYRCEWEDNIKTDLQEVGWGHGLG
jgi:hypothetical protein